VIERDGAQGIIVPRADSHAASTLNPTKTTPPTTARPITVASLSCSHVKTSLKSGAGVEPRPPVPPPPPPLGRLKFVGMLVPPSPISASQTMKPKTNILPKLNGPKRNRFIVSKARPNAPSMLSRPGPGGAPVPSKGGATGAA
jgi:hypothetical protein